VEEVLGQEALEVPILLPLLEVVEMSRVAEVELDLEVLGSATQHAFVSVLDHRLALNHECESWNPASSSLSELDVVRWVEYTPILSELELVGIGFAGFFPFPRPLA